MLTVDTRDPIAHATDLLVEARIHGLVVCEDSWPVGIFTQREALDAVALDAVALDRHAPVEEATSCSLMCLPERTLLYRAAQLMLETRARRMLAVSQHLVRGIASGIDVARLVAAS